MPQIEDDIREWLKKQPKLTQTLIEEFELEVDKLRDIVETLESDAKEQSARIMDLEAALKASHRMSESHQAGKAQAQMRLQQLQRVELELYELKSRGLQDIKGLDLIREGECLRVGPDQGMEMDVNGVRIQTGAVLRIKHTKEIP